MEPWTIFCTKNKMPLITGEYETPLLIGEAHNVQNFTLQTNVTKKVEEF